jgi:uncharacterized membrane protein YcaP (DUF421 family)
MLKSCGALARAWGVHLSCHYAGPWHKRCFTAVERERVSTGAPMMFEDYLLQAAKAAAYYAALLLVVRMAGKRMAGQTTTFDLIVLITLGVVIQSAALDDGVANAATFVITVFVLHRGTTLICARSRRVRHLLRGKPRPLVRDGRVIEQALALEGVTHAELHAGLRKLGYASVEDVRLAVLEETGHISAVGRDAK